MRHIIVVQYVRGHVHGQVHSTPHGGPGHGRRPMCLDGTASGHPAMVRRQGGRYQRQASFDLGQAREGEERVCRK